MRIALCIARRKSIRWKKPKVNYLFHPSGFEMRDCIRVACQTSNICCYCGASFVWILEHRQRYICQPYDRSTLRPANCFPTRKRQERPSTHLAYINLSGMAFLPHSGRKKLPQIAQLRTELRTGPFVLPRLPPAISFIVIIISSPPCRP